MNRTRTAAVALGAAALLAAGGAAPAAAGDGQGEVHLLLNGGFGNRPGELIDIDVQGRLPHGPVTVSSPVFPRPVRLSPYERRTPDPGRGHHGRPAIAMTVEPGTYPLTVEAGGRVVARDRVEVGRPQRPRFTAGSPGEVLRPGERLWMAYDDLYPGESGTSFSVRSPAFRAPVRLAHDPRGADWHNPRLFSGAARLPATVRDGTYTVALTGPGGRVIEEKRLVVRAARPGDRDYLGRARGPAFFGTSAGAGPDAARTDGHEVTAGGQVNVLWRDQAPDPGEEERLTATSPAFERPVTLRRDDSKAGDGAAPRYYGPARVRRGLEAGRYPVTVVSHHGRVSRTAHLVITEAARGSAAAGSAPLLLAAGTGVAAAAGLGVVAFRRRAGRG
ncbi:hypothetical protein [Streptomyces sp. ISL-11]|uniref:hypothetical protein n=1 Tax=Streptomyces sp. ISL-11 TaxID=2819174 RepID=UPI001BEBFF4B|nr:hypothetical protein [Streptomyces sp. ISL-11]MBT2383697.1 hypothetical protein [Streptomyces sp. ISL-11]